MPYLLALVKHDCPVCDQVLPLLDAAGVRVLSQSSASETAAQAERLHLRVTPELDTDLTVSERYDPDAVPAVLLLDGGTERGRVEGIDRARLAELASAAGIALDVDGLPERRPGCASHARDPVIAARLAARRARADGRLRAREIELGGLEDPFEALHDRGLTDGLPVVPPTPERVVAMLAHTARDPQDVVGLIPPYGGRATVEKIAVNAVMAGCAGPELPIVLAAVEAVCVESFAMHGLLATTHPAGPAIIVSGPYAEAAGMNAGVNVLGQGTRANLTIGRALQLVVRNLGGGRPGFEDRAAHGQPGKLGCSFAERLDDGAPWPGLFHAREGADVEETGVTLAALEAPRLVIDQLARDPESLCRSYALALESVSTPRMRMTVDALVLAGPEHGRIFREAGWEREHVQQRLWELTCSPAGGLIRGAGGVAEGLDPKWVPDPDASIPKFVSPDRILLAYAGGDAGLFSMVFGSWVAGEIGSMPVSKSVEPWR